MYMYVYIFLYMMVVGLYKYRNEWISFFIICSYSLVTLEKHYGSIDISLASPTSNSDGLDEIKLFRWANVT